MREIQVDDRQEGNWVKVWEGYDEITAMIIFNKLKDAGLHPVYVDLREWAYKTMGSIKIMVHRYEYGKAIKILSSGWA